MLDFKHTDRTRREFEHLSLEHLDALYSAGLRLTKNERDAEEQDEDQAIGPVAALEDEDVPEAPVCKPPALRLFLF